MPTSAEQAPRFPRQPADRLILTLACLVVIITYVLFIDLKGINTDEGLRLAIINGGEAFSLNGPPPHATWDMVLKSNVHSAYQPLYFLIQNTLMRIARTQDVVFFRLVNIFFLWVCLQGLLTLSKTWPLLPRLFLLGLFSFNAYLFMHVLQIREYIAGIAFYIWSTWLVLRLDREKPGETRYGFGWFAGYGLLLIAGFYVQSWVVFPAIGQGLFLLIRSPAGRWRFYARLALSYGIVLAATLPYLFKNMQKVNVGRWGTEHSMLWPQLSTGFHLVLAGHDPGRSSFADFLFWFWLAVIAGGMLLLLRRNIRTHPAIAVGDYLRQGRLMLLCFGTSLAFQLGYYFKVENLSLWPRYFVIHYFFLIWLIALTARALYDLGTVPGLPLWTRRGMTAVFAALLIMMTATSVFQADSYHRDPYLDTGFSRISNWRVWTAELARLVRPDDVVISHDYISRSTLTFTHPMTNRVLMLHELETSDLRESARLVYMESSGSLPERDSLVARMSALGFPHMQEVKLRSAQDGTVLPEWQFLVFSR